MNKMLETWNEMDRWSLMEARGFTCIMAPASVDIADAVLRWGQMFLTPDVLYTDPEDPDGFGRETDIHVTVKFGLHEAQPGKELLRILEETQPFEIEVGPCTLFENEKFDVVKFDVDSEGLRALNARISELPNSDSHPEYHPHMTVAYVTKGTCGELIGKPLADPTYEPDLRFLVDRVTFSSKDGTKTTLFLGKPNLEPEETLESEQFDLLEEAQREEIDLDALPQETDQYEIVPKGYRDPLGYGFSHGKFYLSPALRWISVEEHEDAAMQLLGKRGIRPNSRDMNPNQTRLELDYGFLRIIDEETNLSYSGTASPSQMVELMRVAKEYPRTLAQIDNDAPGGERILYTRPEDVSSAPVAQATVLIIPEPEAEGGQPRHGIAPGEYDQRGLGKLVEWHKENSDAIQYIADMLEIGNEEYDAPAKMLRQSRNDPNKLSEIAKVLKWG